MERTNYHRITMVIEFNNTLTNHLDNLFSNTNKTRPNFRNKQNFERLPQPMIAMYIKKNSINYDFVVNA